MNDGSFIPPHGNYAELLSYQKAEVVYDLTFRFCERFLARGDRTIDQMVQAARSGKQNIVEGSKASGTSKEMEIKLTNVARASLEELLWITKIFSACGICRFGRRLPRRRFMFGGWGIGPIRPMRPIGLRWRPVPLASWPTSRSASSTRPTTCSISKFDDWKRIFSRKAASAKG